MRSGRLKLWQWLVLLGCTLLTAPLALALSLGDAQILSRLGDPVEVEIPLLQWQEIDLAMSELSAGTPADYQNFGLQWQPLLDTLNFNVVGPNLEGEVRILISSREPVHEPYLELLVVVRWPGGSMLREFTLLFDPPAAAVSVALPEPQAAASVVLGPSAAPGAAVPAPAADATAPAPDAPATDFRTQYAVEVQSITRQPRNTPQTGRNQHRTTVQDSLWSLAQRYQPRAEEADWYQYMLVLHALNPAAFVNGNIALLKASETLELPARQDLARVDRATARTSFESLWRADTASFTSPALESPPALAQTPAPAATASLSDIASADGATVPLLQSATNTVVLAAAEAVSQPSAASAPVTMATPELVAPPATPLPALETPVAPPATSTSVRSLAEAAAPVAVTVANPAGVATTDAPPAAQPMLHKRQQRLDELESMVVLMRVRLQEAQAVAAELNVALARELQRRGEREQQYQQGTLVLTAVVMVLLASLVAAVVLLLKLNGQLKNQARLLQARTQVLLGYKFARRHASANASATAADSREEALDFGPAER